VRSRLRLLAPCLVALGLALAFVAGSSPQQPSLHESADARLFDPGNIISDSVFYDPATMDTAQVQAFLQREGASCTSSLCLKNLRQDTWTRAADGYCGTYEGMAGEPAAAIIAKVGRACGINPQVLLVLLQKEQSLVRTSAPTEEKLRKAVGYGCPDTAPCDAQYYGFYNQLYNAAHRFQYYRAHPGSFGHRVGVVNNVRYHPNAACGTVPVYIQNQATAGLYNYTRTRPTGPRWTPATGPATAARPTAIATSTSTSPTGSAAPRHRGRSRSGASTTSSRRPAWTWARPPRA
jgi:hypothetical protein